MACITPFNVKDANGIYFPVPCGKCPPCLKRRTSGWSFRLRVEARQHLAAHFVTLTFNTDTVPLSKNGFMTLDKRPLQLYFKRLRKLNLKRNNEKVIYYAAGEYGSKTKRPHYHIILFNCHPDDIVHAWKLNLIPIGHVHIGNVSDASIGYCLKYIHKGKFRPLHRNDDREKEFQLCSKGIGAAYLTQATRKYHLDLLTKRCCITIEDGCTIAMPRYYKVKLYDVYQKNEIKSYFANEFKPKIELTDSIRNRIIANHKSKLKQYESSESI